MRRLIFSALMLCAVSIHAADPVFVSGRDSRYGFTNGTVAVSSFTVGEFPAVEGYREITLDEGSSYYVMLDGTSSTATIATSGFLVDADERQRIESNQVIRILLTAGTPSATFRYIERRK